jgi:M6 family metalloprotease-like protein
MLRRYYFLALIAAIACHVGGATAYAQGAARPAVAKLDLSDYRTLDKAITTRLTKTAEMRGTGYLGISMKETNGKVAVGFVQPTAPAGRAGILAGDILVMVDGKTVASPEMLITAVQSKKPGDAVRLSLERDRKPIDVEVTLAAVSRPLSATTNAPDAAKTAEPAKGKGFKGKGGAAFEPALPLWKKDLYRLAVIILEFSDIKANDKITADDWQQAFFSSNSYNKASATGQSVFGSLNDYYREQSYGKFHIEGTVFAPVQLSKKRGDYVQGSGTGNKTVPLAEALDKLAARDGKEALADFDGLAFIYAGARVTTNRGNLYYPHRGSVPWQGKRLPYILGPEGGKNMESISVFAPEFGKLLGLPDLAARTENPGSEGLGVWCLMSNGGGDKGRPGHLCAWCKEQLGWITPAVIDPATKQKLLLSPMQKSPREFLKVIARADGSEYFLLENRVAKGFDADLPGQGLLVWRIVNNRPILEESHGVAGPSGPRVQLDAVPFPSKANQSFTPLTTPSSQALTGAGLPVHLTNIRRLPDGRIAFLVGYEFN